MKNNHIYEIYKVTSKIAKKDIEMNEANLESIDIMLKYKLVSKETIEKLVKSNKLENVENIESILSKY